jgi:hypothetical protein
VDFAEEVYAATVHQGRLAVLDGELKLHYDALGGDADDVVSFANLDPERAWDVAIVSTGDDVALVSVAPDGLDLRLATDPDRSARLSLQAPTFFPQLTAGGGRLLAVASAGPPAVAWASFEGSWLGEATFHRDELPTAWIPGTGRFGAHGSPASGTPAGYDATGAAIFLSTDGNGRIVRWTVTPEAAELDEGTLPSVGPRYFSDLTAAYHEGRFGVMWTQQESSSSEERYLGAAILNEDLQLVGEVTTTRLRGRTGWGDMSVVYCQDRFIFSWRDYSLEESYPSMLRQLDSSSRELGEPIEIDYSAEKSGWNLHCLEDKVAISAPTALLTLGCEVE